MSNSYDASSRKEKRIHGHGADQVTPSVLLNSANRAFFTLPSTLRHGYLFMLQETFIMRNGLYIAFFASFVVAAALCVGLLVPSAQAGDPLCYQQDPQGACTTECATVPGESHQPEQCKEKYRRADRCSTGNGILSSSYCGTQWNTTVAGKDCQHDTGVSCGQKAFTNGTCSG